MNRINFLMQGLEINEVQASLLSELIIDIPNDQLKNFLVFRMRYIKPMQSKELITKTALYDYRRLQVEARLKAGEKVFKSIEEVKFFVEEHYVDKEIGYGLGKYYDFVVLALDKDLNILNKYHQNEHGSYYKLKSNEKAVVYKFLFENQDRIGVVRYIPYFDPKALEHKPKVEDEVDENYIAPNVLKMLGGMKKIGGNK